MTERFFRLDEVSWVDCSRVEYLSMAKSRGDEQKFDLLIILQSGQRLASGPFEQQEARSKLESLALAMEERGE